MKKLIFVLGILAVIVLAGCDKVTEYPEVPEVIPEPVPAEPEVPEVVEEVPEVEEPVLPEVVEPEVPEVVEPVIEEKVSSEIVELKITIDYSITDEDEDEARLEKISMHIRNTKYTVTLDYPKDNLRVKAYTSKDGEEEKTLWIDEIIDKENIRYGMVATLTEGRGSYTFTDNVVIDVEVYDSEDILLAIASKTVTR